MSKPKLHYLVSTNDSPSWCDKSLFIVREFGTKKGVIEHIDCHISLDDFECVSFRIDWGKDLIGHTLDSIESCGFKNLKTITRKEYEALRKEVFKLYKNKMFLKISSVK